MVDDGRKIGWEVIIMNKNKRGFALLLGLGASFLLVLAGVLLAFVYAIISDQVTFHLSSYFACVFF